MKYSQEEQDKILRKLNAGVVGKRKQGKWDFIGKKTKFTKNSVIKLAKQYKYYNDFKTECNGEFQYAERYGFIDKLNLERKFIKDRDLESVKEIAKSCNSRYEFQLKDQGAHSWARDMGLLDEVCSHMTPLKNEWTFKQCEEIAKQYSGRTEWANKHQNSYAKALRQEWVAIIFPEVKTCGRVPTIYSRDEIVKLATKYTKRSDFNRHEQKAMLFARKQGWLKDILNEVFPKK